MAEFTDGLLLVLVHRLLHQYDPGRHAADEIMSSIRSADYTESSKHIYGEETRTQS